MSVKNSTEAVRGHIVNFVQVKFGLAEDVESATPLENLGVDSLGVIQIEMMIRKEFGVRFEDGVLSGESTLDDVVTKTASRLMGVNHG